MYNDRAVTRYISHWKFITPFSFTIEKATITKHPPIHPLPLAPSFVSRVSPASSWERGRRGTVVERTVLFHYGFHREKKSHYPFNEFYSPCNYVDANDVLFEGGRDTRRMYKDQKELFQVIYTALKTCDVFRPSWRTATVFRARKGTRRGEATLREQKVAPRI